MQYSGGRDRLGRRSSVSPHSVTQSKVLYSEWGGVVVELPEWYPHPTRRWGLTHNPFLRVHSKDYLYWSGNTAVGLH